MKSLSSSRTGSCPTGTQIDIDLTLLCVEVVESAEKRLFEDFFFVRRYERYLDRGLEHSFLECFRHIFVAAQALAVFFCGGYQCCRPVSGGAESSCGIN